MFPMVSELLHGVHYVLRHLDLLLPLHQQAVHGLPLQQAGSCCHAVQPEAFVQSFASRPCTKCVQQFGSNLHCHAVPG